MSASNAKVGDDILVTKWAGMGDLILVKDFRHVLKTLKNSDEIKRAEDLIFPNYCGGGRIKHPLQISTCHDATEGEYWGYLRDCKGF